jgi:UDP-glucose 4-epimerase
LLRGEPVVINGDGWQTRDFVNIHDVVRANLRAMETDHVGVYNVGTGCETDVNTVYAVLAGACGSYVSPVHGPAKPGDARRGCLDVRRAAELLGWWPEVELEEGLAHTVEDSSRRLRLTNSLPILRQ